MIDVTCMVLLLSFNHHYDSLFLWYARNIWFTSSCFSQAIHVTQHSGFFCHLQEAPIHLIRHHISMFLDFHPQTQPSNLNNLNTDLLDLRVVSKKPHQKLDVSTKSRGSSWCSTSLRRSTKCWTCGFTTDFAKQKPARSYDKVGVSFQGEQILLQSPSKFDAQNWQPGRWGIYKVLYLPHLKKQRRQLLCLFFCGQNMAKWTSKSTSTYFNANEVPHDPIVYSLQMV